MIEEIVIRQIRVMGYATVVEVVGEVSLRVRGNEKRMQPGDRLQADVGGLLQLGAGAQLKVMTDEGRVVECAGPGLWGLSAVSGQPIDLGAEVAALRKLAAVYSGPLPASPIPETTLRAALVSAEPKRHREHFDAHGCVLWRAETGFLCAVAPHWTANGIADLCERSGERVATRTIDEKILLRLLDE